MRDFSRSHEWRSINTATLRKQHGKERPLIEILDDCARHGVRAVAPWRDQVAANGLQATSEVIRAHGLALSGYVRGGMFTAAAEVGLQLAREDNRRELRAACLVLVVGALPAQAMGGRLVVKSPEHPF